MTMASGRLVYATTTGTLATVDFSGGLPTGSATSSAARRRRPVLAVQRVVGPLSATGSGPHPGGCGPDPSGILRPVSPCSSRDRAAVS